MSGLPGDVLTISHEDFPAAAVVRLGGEVDLDTTGALRDALDAIIHQRRNIILECSALRYIDSAGFHVLFQARQELKQYGCEMLIAAPSPTLNHAFKIINIEKHIHCVPSVAEALRILNGPA
jgi:anti-sigma B factor antagonist